MTRGPLYDKKGNKTRGKGSGGKGFVQIDNGMMVSPAWVSLKGNSVKVFLAMASKHWAFNGELAFSAAQAGEVLGMSSSEGSRCLRELESRGFITREATAKFGATGRQATEWRLTPFPVERSGKVLRPATRDYQRWRPVQTPAAKPTKKQNGCPTGGNKSVIIQLPNPLRATYGT